MKNKIYLIALITTLVTVSSCKKEDNSNPDNGNNSSIAGIITAGSWRVSSFHESGNDRTANFNGYVFTFSSSGTVTAVNSAGTTVGTWRIDDSNVNEFHISIGSTAPLSDLDRGWLITSQSTNEIQMTDDDSSHDRELHFTKI